MYHLWMVDAVYTNHFWIFMTVLGISGSFPKIGSNFGTVETTHIHRCLEFFCAATKVETVTGYTERWDVMRCSVADFPKRLAIKCGW